MSVRTRLSSILLLTGIALSFVPLASSAQTTCPNSGERPATAADLVLMKEAGYPTAYQVLGNCWNPTSKYIGEDPAKAKEYLRSILCKGSSFGGAGPDGTVFGIDGKGGLDGKFAQCAASFLKAASTQLQGAMPLYNGGVNSVCLREGYRTVAQQEKYAEEYRNGGGIACTKGANCEHPRGIAIDVNTTTQENYLKLHALAASFGLVFYLPVNDKVHFIPQKTGCTSGGTVTTQGGAAPSTGSTNPNSFLPKSFYDYPGQAPATAPLAAQVLPALTQFGALNQQQTNPATNPTVTYPTYPTYPTTETIQWPTPTSTIFEVPSPYTYASTTKQPTTTRELTAYEQIQLFNQSFEWSPITTPAATSTPTQNDANASSTIDDTDEGARNTTNSVYDSERPIATTSVSLNPIHVTETFSQNQTPQVGATSGVTQASANQSVIVRLMTALRDVLLVFVQILTRSRATYGFDAPWKPATTTMYR